MRRVLILLGCLCAAAAAVPVLADGSTAAVSAKVASTGRGSKPRIHVTITLNGRTAYSRDVHIAACRNGCITTGLGSSSSSLKVIDLDGSGTPQVVLGLFSGGAHCCFIDEVYRLNPGATTFTPSTHDFLDAGAKIVDLRHNHRYEFLSADARIAESGFTDYADSGAPVQVFSFSAGRFTDATGGYPGLITVDAAKWLKAFHHSHGNGRGFIAAWAADEYRLGRGTLVSRTLAAAKRKGELKAPAFGGPSPSGFITQLHKTLRRLRYSG
jgi:hypothetical protein